ncbi:hypothetical protein GCM10022221_76140 [Actinocorallia aurea]
MSESRDARPRPAGVLLAGLDRRAGEGFTGVLRADGPVSGSVILREGRVVAASTPAAPGPEPLLLRSGRVREAQWSAAFAEGAPDGRLAEALLGVLGPLGVEVLATTALADAIFALALCGVQKLAAEPLDVTETGPLVLLDPGLAAPELIRETERRLAVAAEWDAQGLAFATVPLRTPDAVAHDPLLEAVNGRRSVRDLAFTVGRGLFATMRALADLRDAGAVTLPPAAASPHGPPAPAEPAIPGELPKRMRGASDVIRVLPFRPDR